MTDETKMYEMYENVQNVRKCDTIKVYCTPEMTVRRVRYSGPK
jgi:hypothetical protein